MQNTPSRPAWHEVFLAFLRLGLTSFGGPVAHLGYFRAEFVLRRRWLDEATYGDLLALCQFLPGPASSQMGMALGLMRGGWQGMAAAWVGFTLPSAVAMVLVAEGVARLGDLGHAGWVQGLKLVAVAVVAQAVWGMARSLCPDRVRASVAVAACVLVLALPSAAGQISAIASGAAFGVLALKSPEVFASASLPVPLGRGAAMACLGGFGALLLLLPLSARAADSQTLRLVAAFYRAGALVFGGGHVVLPLLQAAVVPVGWVAQGAFLAGYGAAQAMPGPLFTFAAYLGAAEAAFPNGWLGGLLATLAIFLPSFLLVAGSLPFWESLRRRGRVQAALRGVNAAVVGVLLAALFIPVWTGAVVSPAAFGMALTAFLLLTAWAVPPWAVVGLGALVGGALL